MSLNYANKFCTYIIKELPDSHLLKVLGFRKGTKFMVQSKQPINGPIVVQVGSRSVAIDYGVAKEILVEEVMAN